MVRDITIFVTFFVTCDRDVTENLIDFCGKTTVKRIYIYIQKIYTYRHRHLEILQYSTNRKGYPDNFSQGDSSQAFLRSWIFPSDTAPAHMRREIVQRGIVQRGIVQRGIVSI